MKIMTFFRFVLISKRFKGSLSEKLFLLLTLLSLKLKTIYFDRNNTTRFSRIFEYGVFSYNYKNLLYLLNEIFISNEYYFKSTTDKPVIIDCGANIGMSILYFKKLYPKSKIIAFEANPYAFKLLKENIRNNNITDVEIHNVALFDEETEISFYIGDDIGTLIGSTKSERGGSQELKVDAKKLSGYIENIDSIDLIKMDVEGAEEKILIDLYDSGCIDKTKEYIVEYHHNINGSKSILSSFLKIFEISNYNYNISSHIKYKTFQDIRIHCYKQDIPS